LVGSPVKTCLIVAGSSVMTTVRREESRTVKGVP
jgi:hypothetical protein